MLLIKNLSFSYRNNKDVSNHTIFDNFLLKIKHGESATIVGKSGCGKTTLINLIAGYLQPSSGTIEVNGNRPLGPGRDRIVINQEDDLFGWMTVYQNLKIVAKNKNTEAILHFLHLVGLESSIDKYPNQLSGGMKKKLSLVRALAAEPIFLILDEPFASLDHATAEKIQIEFNTIVRQSFTTILLVTHNIEEAIFLSDRIIVIGGQPAKQKVDIVVNLPKIRNKNIKTSAKFKALKEQIQTSL